MQEIRIPKLGLDTLECNIRGWFVKIGDEVTRGMPLLEVESEKAVIVIDAEAAGAMREIRAPAGQTVAVGAVVGLIEGETQP